MNSYVVRCHLIPFMDRKLHNTLENLQPARLQRFIVLVVPLPLVIIIVGLNIHQVFVAVETLSTCHPLYF